MSVLDNMKIGTKIYAGFGIVLLILVAVAALTFMKLNHVNKNFAAYKELVGETLLVSEISGDVAKNQRDFLEWMRTQTPESRKKFAENKKTFMDLMKPAQESITSPERAKNIDEIEEAAKAFYEAVDKNLALMDKRNRLVRETMDVLGPKMRKFLTQAGISAAGDGDFETATDIGLANQDLLLMRLYALKFLGTNDPADAEEFKKFNERLIESLARSKAGTQNPRRRAMLESVEKLHPEYAEAFHQVEEAIFARKKIIESDILVSGVEMRQKANHVQETMTHDEHRVGEEVEVMISTTVSTVLLLSVIGFVIGALFSFFLTRQILRPIQGMQEAVDTLSAGDLTLSMPFTSGGDEISEMCRKVDQFIERLRDVVSEIKMTSEDVKDKSDEMANDSQGLSDRTEQMASTLEETSASMEELTSTVRTNAESAKEASSEADKARGLAENGSQVAGKAGEAMRKISESSEKITDIITVIDEIAFQTNLLALNAAVEAARAGDAGRGFAVVAQEVRTLAQRSAQSSKDIKSLIDDSSKQVQNGADLVKNAVASLEEICSSISGVTEKVGEIARASEEQSTSLDEVSQAVVEMDSTTQQNASMAQQSKVLAGDMQDKAAMLLEAVSFFKIAEGLKGQARKIIDRTNGSNKARPPAPSAAPLKKTAAAGDAPKASSAAEAENDADWKEF